MALFEKSEAILKNMEQVAQESIRVTIVASNAQQILDELDDEFEKRTSLNKLDQTFLFLTVALQCARQYILANDKFRITDKEGDKLDPGNKSKRETKEWKEWKDILLMKSVPYDASHYDHDNIKEPPGLGGSAHRYRTLGHDPVLGWIFGPMNILSDSLTKYDFITSYSVRNMTICKQILTPQVFSGAIIQIEHDKYCLPAAVVRQAIHFGTDYFTKHGLPVPFISSIDNDISKTLLTQFNIDMYSITRGTAVSILINSLISCIHQLFYNKSQHGSRKLYEVKTRKILSYSNFIASSSNIIYVAIGTYLGDKNAIKKLDIGGFIVTLHRIFSDIHFIGEIKREFIMKSFNEMIRGDEYPF
jgi:hypothetical protein